MATKNTKIETVTIDQLKPYEGQMGPNDENDFLPIYDVVDGENVNKTGGTRALTVKKLKELMMAMSAEYMNKFTRTAFESMSGYSPAQPEPQPSTRTTEPAGANSKEEEPVLTPDWTIMLNAAYQYIKNNVYDIPGRNSGTPSLDCLNEAFCAAIQKAQANGIVHLDNDIFARLNESVLAPFVSASAYRDETGTLRAPGVFYKENKGEASMPKGGLNFDGEHVWNYDSANNSWSDKELDYINGTQKPECAYPITDQSYRTLSGIELPYGYIIAPDKAPSQHKAHLAATKQNGVDVYQQAMTWTATPDGQVSTDNLTFKTLRLSTPDNLLMIYTNEQGEEVSFDISLNPITIPVLPVFSSPETSPATKKADELFEEVPMLVWGDPQNVSPIQVNKCECTDVPIRKYRVDYTPSVEGDPEATTLFFYFKNNVSPIENQWIPSVNGTLITDWDLSTEPDIYKCTLETDSFWTTKSDLKTYYNDQFGSWTVSQTAWTRPTHTEPFYLDPAATIHEAGYEITDPSNPFTLYEIDKSSGQWVFKYKQADSENPYAVTIYSASGYYPEPGSGYEAYPTFGGQEPTYYEHIYELTWTGWTQTQSPLVRCTQQADDVWTCEVLHYYSDLTSIPCCLVKTSREELLNQLINENRLVATATDKEAQRIVPYIYDTSAGDQMPLDKEFYYSYFLSCLPKEFASAFFDQLTSFVKDLIAPWLDPEDNSDDGK